MTEPADRSITFQLERRDYLLANRLFTRKRMLRPVNLVFFAVFLLIYLAVFLGPWRNPPPRFTVLLLHGVLIFWIVMSVLIYFVILPYQSRKVFAEQKGFAYPLTYRWTDAGFTTQNQQGEAFMPWQDFFRWSEDASTILLYHSSLLFTMLPKRVLSQPQIDDLRRRITVPKL